MMPKTAKWSNSRSTFCIGQLIEKHAGLSSSWEDTEHLGMRHFHLQHVLLLCSGVPLTMWGSEERSFLIGGLWRLLWWTYPQADEFYITNLQFSKFLEIIGWFSVYARDSNQSFSPPWEYTFWMSASTSQKTCLWEGGRRRLLSLLGWPTHSCRLRIESCSAQTSDKCLASPSNPRHVPTQLVLLIQVKESSSSRMLA